MKPGDHPDFFRFPAPAGRSRESTIELDRHGRFFHDGEPVEHAGMAAAFGRWVRRHPDDGRWILSNDYDWCYFTVADTGYFVADVLRGEEGPILRLSDDTSEPLDPTTLTLDDDGVLRARVKDGKEGARFMRQAQLAMEPLLADEEPLAVVVDGQHHPIAPTSS
jgi:hypothetical protein